ncbi:MAG TPA: lipid A biosynthesis acyltransferase [Gammaproteobacteria bacterium]|nr:lipid A biosynthesis acyltransferase [Gammaproteobacteria bacterium]
MPSPKTFWQARYPRLRYGVVWLGFAMLRAIVRLPLRWQLALGRTAGAMTRRLAVGRRKVALRNLQICFPELSDTERARLCKRHFEALGMSIVEMAMGWFGDPEKIERHVAFEGLDHLNRAIEARRGVILFSAHFTSFEIFFPILRRHCPRISGMYKEQRNPLMNEIMNAGRGRNVDRLIAKDNVREMLRELGHKGVFWYASDQKFAGKSSALIPFFGEPAMTNTAISRIAARTGAIVLTYFCRRLDGPEPRYVATIGAPLPDFPTADASADVRRLVAELEAFIRRCPEQYWWIHQRFSGRPESLPNIYASKKSLP